MEKRNGFIRRSYTSSSEEYEEQDMFTLEDEIESGFNSPINIASTKRSSPLSISRRLPSAARMIPSGVHKHQHHDDDGDDDDGMMQHSSAPVNIPDWSKIYGNIQGRTNDDAHEEEEEEEDDVEGTLALPPHEWLARKNARTQISCFSVSEGTLKGRQLTRVRHAVLTKTGFI